MLNIDINGLSNISSEELTAYVEKLTTHIEKGKGLKHLEISVNQCSLQAIEQPMASSKEVIEDLHAVILKSIEMRLDSSHKMQLDTIRKIHDQMLATLATKDDSISNLPENALRNIFSMLKVREADPIKDVNKLWRQLGSDQQILMINDSQIRLSKLFKSSNEAINWLTANPACQKLEYADLIFLKGEWSDEYLEKLIQLCPHINVLVLCIA
jgi:hypothetical protein